MRTFLVVFALFLALSSAAQIKVKDNKVSKIVGGSAADEGQFKFQVSLKIFDSPTSFGACGGFILDAIHIGTAAHCLHDFDGPASNIFVQAGTTDISSFSNGQLHRALSYVIHPSYDPESNYYDAAIITLQTALDFDGTVRTIDLATENPANGADTYIAGWGTTTEGGDTSDALLWVTLPYVSFSDCSKVYDGLDEDLQVCAGGQEGKDSCQGDSGGALFTSSDPETNTDASVFGINSFGFGCGRAGTPGVYASVAGFAGEWLKGYLTGTYAAACRSYCFYAYRTCKVVTGRSCRGRKRRCVNSCYDI
jgi:secreted trypsin-like serine protease